MSLALVQRILQQLPGDDLEGQCLFGTLKNRQHPGIDKVTAYRGLLGVTHATVYLQRLPRNPLCRPTGKQLNQARLHLPLAAVQ